MVRNARRRLGILPPVKPAREGDGVAVVEIAADAPIASIAERSDIGVRGLTVAPHHTYDIREADVNRLLLSVVTHAARRRLGAYVQLPGRSFELTPDTVQRATRTIGGKRPRFRVLITDGDRTIENIAIELWSESPRALRPRSADRAIQLLSPGDVRPAADPHRIETDIDFPIDAVYTWVDSNDSKWRALAADHLDLDAIDADRYSQADELRYSLRSLETFAPWINRIHILSNCSPPSWLETSDRIRWVDHAEVMDKDQRPQFNSGAIDTYLHHIPELEEHFLYLNDDFMLWDSAVPATFFTWDDRSIAHLSGDSSVVYLEQVVAAGDAKPSQHSRVNAANLLERHIGVYPTRLHAHVPYALRRSLLAAMEEEFATEMAATRASRVRRDSDVSFVALLYHHLTESRGQTIMRNEAGAFVTRNNYRRPRLRKSLRNSAFVCLQDSRGSGADPEYQAFKRQVLEQALPLHSRAETPTASRGEASSA